MKRILIAGLAAFTLFGMSGIAMANIKLNICLTGVRMSCNLTVSKKKFKSAKDKEVFLKNCMSLGTHQCRLRLGLKKKKNTLSRRARQRKLKMAAYKRRRQKDLKSKKGTTAPKRSCRSLCRAQTRVRSRAKKFRNTKAMRAWNIQCINQCTRSRRTVSRRMAPPRRVVRKVSGASCRTSCRASVRKMRFRRPGDARKWYNTCLKRCSSSGTSVTSTYRRPAARRTAPARSSGNSYQGVSLPSSRTRRSCTRACRVGVRKLLRNKTIRSKSAANSWVRRCFRVCLKK